MMRKQKIRNIRDIELCIDLDAQVPSSHPKNAKFGTSDYNAVEQHIKSSGNLDSVRKTAAENEVHLVIDYVQLFSDES